MLEYDGPNLRDRFAKALSFLFYLHSPNLSGHFLQNFIHFIKFRTYNFLVCYFSDNIILYWNFICMSQTVLEKWERTYRPLLSAVVFYQD